MPFLNDSAISAFEAGLDAVAHRQRVTSHNIANVATPGFIARRTAFEASLRTAIERGTPDDFDRTTHTTDDAPRFDGNNVDLEQETSILIKSGLHYDSLVQALNYRLGLYRTAIGRR